MSRIVLNIQDNAARPVSFPLGAANAQRNQIDARLMDEWAVASRTR